MPKVGASRGSFIVCSLLHLGCMKQLIVTGFICEEDPPSMMTGFCLKTASEYLLTHFSIQLCNTSVFGCMDDLVKMSVATSVSRFSVADVPGFCVRS